MKNYRCILESVQGTLYIRNIMADDIISLKAKVWAMDVKSLVQFEEII